MAGIFGAMGLNDTDRVFQATAGQAVIYDYIREYLTRYNAELAAMTAIFRQETTASFKERYKLPGGGRLQRRGGQAPSGAVKAYGGNDVCYPLDDFGVVVGGDDVSRAYMTVADLDRHVNTVVQQDTATVRWEMLHRLLDNVQSTLVDPLHGTLTVEPLANGDSATYPPVLGSETEATETHYLSAGYAATAISDTNNPYLTIRDELEEHFGAVQGGSSIVCFINPAERPETEDLTDFDAVNDRFTAPGQDTDTLMNLPGGLPGQILGRTNGVWVVEWRWIPSGYILAVDTDAVPPLKERIDPADTGLGAGLQLVATDANYPFETSFWRHRFGFGCGNRLNGVAMFVSASAWTIPSTYD